MKMRKAFLLLALFAVLVFTGCGSDLPKADMVLLHGNVITVDDALPRAQAVAVGSDTIIAVGSDEEITKYIGEKTYVLDLKGKTVLPGLIESHAHFMATGKALMELDLSDAKNWDEIIARAAEKAQELKPGEWIIGRGWHREKWDPPASPNVEGYPVHDELSRATPRNPVLFSHASGHAVFANKLAMQLAGIDSSTPDPPGGRIVRDSTGRAIGVFEEDAADLIRRVYEKQTKNISPQRRLAIYRKQAELASRECVRNGLTTFHDAGESFEMIDILKNFVDEGLIKPRLYVMVYEDNIKRLKEKLPKYKIIGYANNHLTVRAYKRYIDGALGSRGALMLTPYADMPGYSGLMVTPLGKLEKQMRVAFENGFQVCTHAIGDRGNRLVLNLYEKIFGNKAKGNDFRWRIEHAQHLSTYDIPRFAKLGVIAAMQGIHCTSDAGFVIKRLGYERAKRGAYVWRKLIDSGAIICNGTDSPVEKLNPIKNFYASVTRRTDDGKEFFPEEKMTRMEALRSYTINGAYAAFEENIKGSITPGKLADFTVVSKNILTVPDWDILNTKILYTIIGGKIVFDASKKQ
jgi:predicted amidohydrolase YtcJ